MASTAMQNVLHPAPPSGPACEPIVDKSRLHGQRRSIVYNYPSPNAMERQKAGGCAGAGGSWLTLVKRSCRQLGLTVATQPANRAAHRFHVLDEGQDEVGLRAASQSRHHRIQRVRVRHNAALLHALHLGFNVNVSRCHQCIEDCPRDGSPLSVFSSLADRAGGRQCSACRYQHENLYPESGRVQPDFREGRQGCLCLKLVSTQGQAPRRGASS